MGYSSRIMAESWESNTLYWVALADQMHIAPPQLNVLIPEWTAAGGGTDFRLASGGLAGAAEVVADGGQEVMQKNSPASSGEQKAAALN